MPSAIIKRFTVEGARAFPFDMLRADQCWPAASADAARIGPGDVSNESDEGRSRAVTLETMAKYSPNRQRWLSCGWRVTD